MIARFLPHITWLERPLIHPRSSEYWAINKIPCEWDFSFGKFPGPSQIPIPTIFPKPFFWAIFKPSWDFFSGIQVGLGFGKNRFKIKIWPNVRFYILTGKVMFMRICTLYLTLSNRYFIKNLFGGALMDCKDWQLVCCYTRQKALDDGVLVDVSDFVSDAVSSSKCNTQSLGIGVF